MSEVNNFALTIYTEISTLLPLKSNSFRKCSAELNLRNTFLNACIKFTDLHPDAVAKNFEKQLRGIFTEDTFTQFFSVGIAAQTAGPCQHYPSFLQFKQPSDKY